MHANIIVVQAGKITRLVAFLELLIKRVMQMCENCLAGPAIHMHTLASYNGNRFWEHKILYNKLNYQIHP